MSAGRATLKKKKSLTENRKRCCYSHSLEFLGLGPKKFREIFLAENGVMTVSGTSLHTVEAKAFLTI